MKRYRTVSHGDDQLLGSASQKRKQSDARDDEGVSHHKEEFGSDTAKPNDTRLCLLSLVCDQHLSNKKRKTSQRQGNTQGNHTDMVQKVPGEKDERKEEMLRVLKSAEEALGITTPVVISPIEGENADVASDAEKPTYTHKDQSLGITKSKQEEPAVIAKEGTVEQEDNEENPSIWKEVCRPVPLPPRLPMVPAGFVFPLYKPPNTI